MYVTTYLIQKNCQLHGVKKCRIFSYSKYMRLFQHLSTYVLTSALTRTFFRRYTMLKTPVMLALDCCLSV